MWVLCLLLALAAFFNKGLGRTRIGWTLVWAFFALMFIILPNFHR